VDAVLDHEETLGLAKIEGLDRAEVRIEGGQDAGFDSIDRKFTSKPNNDPRPRVKVPGHHALENSRGQDNGFGRESRASLDQALSRAHVDPATVGGLAEHLGGDTRVSAPGEGDESTDRLGLFSFLFVCHGLCKPHDDESPVCLGDPDRGQCHPAPVGRLRSVYELGQHDRGRRGQHENGSDE
jgi:hypothetical protein